MENRNCVHGKVMKFTFHICVGTLTVYIDGIVHSVTNGIIPRCLLLHRLYNHRKPGTCPVFGNGVCIMYVV